MHPARRWNWRFSDQAVRAAGAVVVAPWSCDRPVKKSLADMARSLGLMAVIVAALLFVGARYLIMPGSADRFPPVDYTAEVQAFPRDVGAPILAPAGLPASWRANAARLTHPGPQLSRLHIGWAVPGSRFAGLDEGNGDGSALISDVLGSRGLAVRATTSIGGATWQQRESDRGEPALTRELGAVTIVVTGDATQAQLALLAASLREQSPT